MSWLVEILLPLTDNEGRDFGREAFAGVREELVARFGGLTAFTRSPAEGVWEEGEGRERDDIVVLEVMVDALDRSWWAAYRGELERRFAQDEIVVRAGEVTRL
ncbi:MAG: hypothetical protein JO013_09370 [Alphaproteobacteria bacterium]|nr:hypothetical protein [Alphaproteobacteria bacterium]